MTTRPLAILLLAALTLTGCQSITPEPAEPARVEKVPLPEPEPTALTPPIELPEQMQPRARMVQIALDQWHLWGEQTVRLYPDGSSCVTHAPLPPVSYSIERAADDLSGEPRLCQSYPDGTGVEATLEGCAMAQRYWRIVGKEPNCSQVKTGRWAWSAAFISWIMRSAGLDQTQFLTSESHSGYVVDARDGYLANSAFEIVPLPAAPQVGDMVCAVREDPIGRVMEPKDVTLRGTPMHCDLVVSLDPASRTFKGIGGNVQQSVSLVTMDMDENSMIQYSHLSTRPFVLIMRNKLP